MADFIPTKDIDLASWSTIFLAAITAAPTAYGLVAGDATAYGVLDTDFQAKLALVQDPATRTSPVIADKDASRLALVAKARSLGRIAQAFPGITPILLTAAGLTVRDTLPSDVPAPTSSPVIEAYDLMETTPRIAWHDSVLSNPRAKPPGAINCQVFIGYGATPSATPTAYDYVGSFGRMPVTLTIPSAQQGKFAFVHGRWQTRKGLVGPMGADVVFAVPA